MKGMSQQDVINALIEKSKQELDSPIKPKQGSRTWESPVGYRYLVQWSNSVLLRYLIRQFTVTLPKSEYRRKAQLDDAARSTVRNIEEGFKRSNTSTYIEFIGFSQGSLEEVKGDIRDLVEDKFLPTMPGSSLKGVGLDLGDLNTVLKPNSLKEVKGNLEDVIDDVSTNNPQYTAKSFTPRAIPGYTPLDILYLPLKQLKVTDLTYEMFLELINKTDFLFRSLVESLELKLSNDQKHYKVEQAKIKDAIKSK